VIEPWPPAVVIGTSIHLLVHAFTNNVVPAADRPHRRPPTRSNGFLKIPLRRNTFIDLNAVLTAALNFPILAAVVYFNSSCGVP